MLQACPSCGASIAVDAKFCPECGSVTRQPAVSGTRRQVTVLFCDVVGSTELAHRVDAETVQSLMNRYFELAEAAVERHGGTLEKFIGDAVMAVFGLPELHEDDALRAVRAAVDVRDAVARIGAEIKAETIGLQVRVGVNTGEVVASGETQRQRLVTGDAVNIAARLQQTAEPGDIVIGSVTRGLVRDAFDAEPLGLIELKGIAAPVRAYRLASIRADTPAARAATPMMGRAAELAAIRSAFDVTVSSKATRLVTIVGPAGIGKSRLTHEFLASVRQSATVLRGRCLPYGEGITYWPIAMALRSAAGIEDTDDLRAASLKLTAYVGDIAAADRIAVQLGGAIGIVASGSVREEIGWAFRRLLEAKADIRPVVLVVDDIQWAEETLLDLLEGIAVLSGAAPILLMCMARPELFESRPGWATDVREAMTLRLDALPSGVMAELIANVTAWGPLPASVADIVASTAEGNPLFVEELIAMLIDDGILRRANGGWQTTLSAGAIKVPPTIQALLAARLDRLEPGDRALAQRGAVVGRIFQRAAVLELSPPGERSRVDGRLLNLVRREVVRPDPGGEEDDAYRFLHLLMRDAAYEGLPKRERAELHERLGAWLGSLVGDRLPEFEEIVAYHFEQAFQYRQELGLDGERTLIVRDEAARHLLASAWRALDRSDFSGAVGLLQRTLDTIEALDPQRIELWAEQVDALTQVGRLSEASLAVETTRLDLAQRPVDARSQAWFDLIRSDVALWAGSGTAWNFDEARAAAQRAVASFEQAGDPGGLCRAWQSLALGDWWLMRVAAARTEWLRALDYAQQAGRRGRELTILFWLTSAVAHGPTPIQAALAELDAIVRSAGGDLRVEAAALRSRAFLLAWRGSSGEAEAALAASTARFEELGMQLDAGGNESQVSYFLGLATGDVAATRRRIEASASRLSAIGDVGYLSTALAYAATTMLTSGELDEASRTIELASSIGSTDDLLTHSTCLLVRAGVDAARGNLDVAVRAADAALALLADSDGDMWVGDVHVRAAEIAVLTGDRDKALYLLGIARQRFVRKGAEAFVEIVDRRSDSIEHGGRQQS